MKRLTAYRENARHRRVLRAARLRTTFHIGIPGILVLVGIAAALIATSEAAYTKVQSDQAIAAAEQMVSAFEAQVSRLEDDNAPAYQIRFAQLRVQAAENMLRRIKADERAYIDAYGRNATEAAVINYIKGKLLVTDILSAAETAFSSTKGLSDAYSSRPTDIQQNYEGAVRRLLGNDTTLQGDALDRYVAVAEYQHLVRLLQARGYDPNDPAFVNTIKKFMTDHYLQDGETLPPDDVRLIMDMLVNQTYGIPMPAELEDEDNSWMMPDLPPTLMEELPTATSDTLPTPFSTPVAPPPDDGQVHGRPEPAETPSDVEQVIADYNAAFRAFDDDCIALRQDAWNRMNEVKGNAWSGYTPECSNSASAYIFDSRWWTMDASYAPCALAAADRYMAALQSDVDAYVAGTMDIPGYEASGEAALEELFWAIEACRTAACREGCAANDQLGIYTGSPRIGDSCECR